MWGYPPPPPPQKKRSKTKIILGSVAAIFVVWFMIGFIGGGNDKPTPTAASASTSSTAAPAVPVDNTAPAGSAVRDGKFEFRVVSIERAKTVSDPTDNPYMTVTAQGEFILVTLSVQNIGDQPQNYFGDNQKLVDAAGREYGANSEAGLWMNTDDSIMGDINPGNSIQVRVAFDVPVGTQAGELELHDSMFSGGVSVRLA